MTCSSKRRLSEVPKSNNHVTTSKPVQEPPKYDGKSSWEAFLVQFETAAKLQMERRTESVVFSNVFSRKRKSNISVNKRSDYAELVTALTSRFGITHQSDLARAKLKTRVKKREESLPELAESVESLTRKAYPDASTELKDGPARNHFIDALYEEELEDPRLKIRQARPQSLLAALETALRAGVISVSQSA